MAVEPENMCCRPDEKIGAGVLADCWQLIERERGRERGSSTMLPLTLRAYKGNKTENTREQQNRGNARETQSQGQDCERIVVPYMCYIRCIFRSPPTVWAYSSIIIRWFKTNLRQP